MTPMQIHKLRKKFFNRFPPEAFRGRFITVLPITYKPEEIWEWLEIELVKTLTRRDDD